MLEFAFFLFFFPVLNEDVVFAGAGVFKIQKGSTIRPGRAQVAILSIGAFAASMPVKPLADIIAGYACYDRHTKNGQICKSNAII